MKRFERNYVNPRSVISFSGVSNIARSTKTPRKKILEKLADQNTYVVHREAKRPRYYNPFVLYKKRILLQTDLIDMTNLVEWNKGYKWILIVVDAFSRKCWVRVLKNKTADLVLEKFKEIYKETGPFQRLMSDAGSEFIAKQFKAFLRSKKIKFIRGNPHAPHVERLNRTIQSKLFKFMTENETKVWTKAIHDVVHAYNSRHHSTIKMSPNRADLDKHRNQVVANLSLYYSKSFMKRKEPKFKKGDIVSIQKIKNIFAKGYEKVFTEELFKVRKVHTKLPIPQYTIGEYYGNKLLAGRFYENELQKATYEVFKIEQVLDKRINEETGEEELLVKWMGWPDSHNEWIPKERVTRDFSEERSKEELVNKTNDPESSEEDVSS